MILRREIQDSDDDDNGDFSPIKSPVKSAPESRWTVTASNAAISRDTESTTLSFFQSVYNEQRAAAKVLEIGPGKGEDIKGESSLSTSAIAGATSSTSTTDCRGIRSKKESKDEAPDVTQVTNTGAIAIWDVPDSPEDSVADLGAKSLKDRPRQKRSE
jgi:hypothetical protein